MYYMYRVLSCILLCFIISASYGQHIVKGKVVDGQTKEPLYGVNVYPASLLVGTTTSQNGSFLLNAPSPFKEIRFSFIGFESKTIKVEAGMDLIVELKPTTANLQQVVVTANRESSLRTEAPVAISKLSASLINDTKPTNIYEIINKTPGVVMLNYNNEQHAMGIRQPMGTSAYFLYLEDGVPVRPMGVFNHNALIEMNVLSISSVEVVKGPASSIYGPEAVGGAINFLTHKPTAVPVAKIGVQADQFGYKRVQFGTGGYLTPKFGIYLGGYLANQRDSWQTRSDFDKTSLNFRADYHLTQKVKLTGTLAFNDYYSQTGGSVDSVSFYNREYTSTTDFTYRKVRSLRSRLTLEKIWSENAHTSITPFYRYNDLGQNPSYSIRWKSGSETATGEINRNRFHSYGLIAQHSQKFKFLGSKLLFGASYDYSPTDYTSYVIELKALLREDKKSVSEYDLLQERPDLLLANYKAQIQNSAAYLQFDFHPIKDLMISLGGRFDRMSFQYNNYLDSTSGSKAYQQFTPKMGITYKLAEGKGLYANISQGFSPPGLTSIFRKRNNVQAGESPFYFDLKSAQFNNYEVGGWASLIENRIYVDIAMYQMNGRNELLNVRLPDNSTDYRSAGKTLHKGIEYSLTYKPVEEILFRVGGTNAAHKFIDFELSKKETDELKNADGKIMPQAPSWIANTEVTYKPKWFENFRVSVEWQRISSYYQNQVNTWKYNDRTAFGAKGVSVINLRTAYQWNGIELFVNVLNLTNELYANAVTRGNSKSDRATYTPAAPRTFNIGIQYNFVGKKELWKNSK
jgi:iron complex outermembrane recepter protein